MKLITTNLYCSYCDRYIDLDETNYNEIINPILHIKGDFDVKKAHLKRIGKLTKEKEEYFKGIEEGIKIVLDEFGLGD